MVNPDELTHLMFVCLSFLLFCFVLHSIQYNTIQNQYSPFGAPTTVQVRTGSADSNCNNCMVISEPCLALLTHAIV